MQIYITDNASTDSTGDTVAKRMAEYPFIYYHRHESNLGPDANFEFALKQPDTDYVWLLGDSYLIPENGINYVLDRIREDSSRYDMMLFNVDNAVVTVPAQDYSDCNNLLSDLFWLTTCMSCLVFSRHLILSANFERYRNTSFLHTGVIYEYISKGRFKILWEPALSIVRWRDFNGVKKLGWQSNVLDIWFQNRINLIFSLPPAYSLETKLKVAKEVHAYNRVSMMHLVGYRCSGALNSKSYKKFKYVFPIAAPQPGFAIFLVSILPRVVSRLMLKMKNPYKV